MERMNENKEVDVTWTVLSTVLLLLIQIYAKPKLIGGKKWISYKLCSYMCFCLVITIFYLFVNINEITRRCEEIYHRFILLGATIILEILFAINILSDDSSKGVEIV